MENIGEKIMEHEGLADYAVEQGLREDASYVEARLEGVMGDQLLLRNGNLEVGGFFRSYGLGVRVLVNGAMGFCSVNDLSTREKVRGVVCNAVRLARASSKLRKEAIKFSDEEVVDVRYGGKFKENVLDVDLEEKISLLFDVDKAVDVDSCDVFIPFRLMHLLSFNREEYLVTSEGTRVRSFIPRVFFTSLFTAFNKVNNQSEQGPIQKGSSGGWEVVRDWDLRGVVEREVGILSKVLREGREPPKGVIDCVIGSNITGIAAHENCGHPSEADRILGREGAQAGESFLNREMLGHRIGNEEVTIVDDPTLEGSYGFYLYDDEGIRARERVLIDKGIYKGMLHNRETAYFMGTQSNGASRSSGYNREPIVRMANTYMKPGDYASLEALMEDIKLGVYIVSFTEWNIDDRRFQSKYVGREAYLIEKGGLKYPVRRPVLEITTPALFGSIDGCTREIEFDAALCGKSNPEQIAPVWHGGPCARLKNVRLG